MDGRRVYDKLNLALNAANAANIELLKRESRAQQAQMSEYQRREAERSFAHWRQSPDGEYFLKWQKTVQPQISYILSAEEEWFAAHDALAKQEISPEERQRYSTNTWIPAPRKHPIVKR